MRIIAGQFKGRRLWCPNRRGVRPTSERVREAVFDALGSHVQSSLVLDIFAGTGALGLEALSRGASKVFFVEKNRSAVQIIQRNVGELGVADLVSVKVCGAVEAINVFDRSEETFTLIFMDPPYNTHDIDHVWQQPGLRRVMSDIGVLVVESRFPNTNHNPPDFLEKWFARTYGDTLVEMFRLREEE